MGNKHAYFYKIKFKIFFLRCFPTRRVLLPWPPLLAVKSGIFNFFPFQTASKSTVNRAEARRRRCLDTRPPPAARWNSAPATLSSGQTRGGGSQWTSRGSSSRNWREGRREEEVNYEAILFFQKKKNHKKVPTWNLWHMIYRQWEYKKCKILIPPISNCRPVQFPEDSISSWSMSICNHVSWFTLHNYPQTN